MSTYNNYFLLYLEVIDKILETAKKWKDVKQQMQGIKITTYNKYFK
jgi:hypothetical protein